MLASALGVGWVYSNKGCEECDAGFLIVQFISDELFLLSSKLQGADNGSNALNPAESWNFFRKQGGKGKKGKDKKHNRESSKVN